MNYLLENSHTIPFQVFTNEQLVKLQNEIFEYLSDNSSEFKDDNFIHIPNLGKTFPNILDVILSDKVFEFISQLFNEPVLVQNNLFIKPPKNGIGIPWHIDFPYWQKRNDKIQFITLWTNVFNAKENGNIEYITKSHTLSDTYLDPLLNGKSIEEIFGSEFFNNNQNYLSVKLDEGIGQYHHPLIIHRSTTNNSDKYAISLGIVFSDRQIIENILNLGQGFPFKIEKGTTINDFINIKNYRQQGFGKMGADVQN